MKIRYKKNTYDLDFEIAIRAGALTKIPKTAPLTVEDLKDGDIFKFRNACAICVRDKFYPTLYVCRQLHPRDCKDYQRIASDTSIPGLKVDLRKMETVTHCVFTNGTEVAILRRNGKYETTKPV